MMLRNLIASASCLCLVGLIASGLTAFDGTISDATVGSAGLEMKWFTQVDTGVRGEVIDMHLNVNENKATTFFEIEFGLGREIVSENDLDAFGQPRGIEGAQEYAETRKMILEKELAARGLENTEVIIEKYTLPETTLYTLTSDGLVTAIDADSGRIRWASVIGTREYPSIGIGSSNNYVAAINGISLYCLDADNGKVIFTNKCQSVVTASPAVSNEFVYVPQANGRVEVFPIVTKGVGSERYIGAGLAKARPLLTENSVSWTTTAGHLNVALHDAEKLDFTLREMSDEEKSRYTESELIQKQEREESRMRLRIREAIGGITYRLRTGDTLVAPAAVQNETLFVTTLGGFVYAVDEKKGSIAWEFSTGQEIEDGPITIGNHLYVVTAENSLFKLKLDSGEAAWEQPIRGIARYVGASQDKLFVLGRLGNLKVLDQESGQLLGEVEGTGINLVYQNSVTDRMFVGNVKGSIQCLAEVNSKIPTFHGQDLTAEMAAEAAEPAVEADEAKQDDDDPFKMLDTPPADQPAEISDEDNPFGGGGNAADDPQMDDDNPFGGGGGSTDNPPDNNNPFGGGGSSDDDDDDDNPFGGGGR